MTRIFIIVIFLISISCSTTRNIGNSNEINRVLKAFGKKTTSSPREIYFKSVNISPNFPNISRKELIKQPGKMVVNSYNQNYLEKWKSVLDSLPNNSKQETGVKEKINNKFKINPDNLFTAKDKKFMLEQIDAQNNVKWQKSKLSDLHLTKSNKATKISIPVFSKDHRLAMIFLSTSSYEGVEVYRKINEVWEFYFGSTFLIE